MITTGAGGPLAEITCVSGEAFCISGPSGQLHAGGQHGLFVRDTRVLDLLEVRIDDREPAALLGRRVGAHAARFTCSWAPEDYEHPDPPVLLDRRRVVSASLVEELHLTNYGTDEVSFWLSVGAATDFAYIFDVKHGRPPTRAGAQACENGLAFTRPAEELAAELTADRAVDEVDPERGRLRWRVRLSPRQTWSVALSVTLQDGQRRVVPTATWAVDEASPSAAAPWEAPRARCSDANVDELVGQSVEDLASLLVADAEHPADKYAAAGSPWFLTLFGRDSLWAAFMALPLGVDLAAQTLRVLARRQGTRVDPETEEAPGKILHEVRHGGLASRADLPPLYYGSMDATPLFVILLHEAWRWGLAAGHVEELLPATERALGWLADHADPDGDGFLEYQQSGARGLANQGWKDSEDGVQFADGRLAEPPIALCEVQGYAYAAAVRGAELLDAFGRGGGDGWRAWARALADRFRAAFWVGDGADAYPAVALDGAKRRVDSVASNMGHLLATGMLDEAETTRVAGRLGSADMDSGWGLRTLTSASPRFNPLSYHGGSVWPHDTAIAVHGLAAAGHTEQARRLLQGLVAAAPYFRYRLPELLGGEQRDPGGFPLPYPAACRPQAWAAGAGLLLLRSLIGLEPDAPNGHLSLRPLWPPPYPRLRVEGLVVAGGRLSLTLTPDEGVVVHEQPPGLAVRVETTDQPPARTRS